MGSQNRRKAVRRAAATLAVTTAPAPALGVVLTGHGLPWALLPIGSAVAAIGAARTRQDVTPEPDDPEPVRPRVVFVMGSAYAEDDPSTTGERPDVITAEYYWSEEVA